MNNCRQTFSTVLKQDDLTGALYLEEQSMWLASPMSEDQQLPELFQFNTAQRPKTLRRAKPKGFQK